MADFTDLPDDAYLRVFAADRNFSDDEVANLRERMISFLPTWTSHEAPIRAAFDVRHGRFLLVAADGNPGPISGCSKDSLLHQVRECEQAFGVKFIESPPVCFKRGDEVVCVDRPGFASRVEAGEVDGTTTVFDNTVYQVAQLRDGTWETTAANSWHARAFPALASSSSN